MSSVSSTSSINITRRLQSTAGIVDDDFESIPVQRGVEDQLSEQQLRELYDSEEIDRFLNLFSAYVTEVRLPDTLDSTNHQSRVNINEKEGEAEEGDWISIHGIPKPLRSVPPVPMPPSRYLSNYVAQHFIIPNLPPPPLPQPLFTFGRLRVTAQRLYLAIESSYKPFFVDLGQLAKWENRMRSFIYCTVFWMLWWYNLLLPSAFLRIFYAIIRRKIFSYPTLQELRIRRSEISRANVFGDAVQTRLIPSSPFGLQELWRIFKVFNKPKMNKVMEVMKDNMKDQENIGNTKEVDLNDSGKQYENSDPVTQPPEEAATVPDDFQDAKQDKDTKRAILQALGDIADFHERIKNIAIWRRPASSYVYSGVIFFLFMLTLFLPAKYIAKFLYAMGGIMFWHILPVIVAMPPADRIRIAPAFNDVPTDADYAMELISQRVASGLAIKSTPFRKPRSQNAETSGYVPMPSQTGQKSVDWKKWGDRAALGKSWANEKKRLFAGNEWRRTSTSPLRNTEPELLQSLPKPRIETHTFPAQHTSAPGLITLTPITFFFTPLMSSTAKITIAFNHLRGVKKTGLLKGISLRWAETQEDNNIAEKEEKFIWVGDRDELFARLIGSGGQRWLKA